jgi:hypothetical protein
MRFQRHTSAAAAAVEAAVQQLRPIAAHKAATEQQQQLLRCAYCVKTAVQCTAKPARVSRLPLERCQHLQLVLLGCPPPCQLYVRMH